MKIPAADAAKKLGLSVPEFIDAAAGLVGELSETWPEIDDGYVDTMRHLYGLRQPSVEGGQILLGHVPRLRDRAAPPTAGTSVEYAKLRILDKLKRTNRWSGNAVSHDTLRNHYCQGIDGFDEALEQLIDADLIRVGGKGSRRRGPFSLNPKKKAEIERRLAEFRKR